MRQMLQTLTAIARDAIRQTRQHMRQAKAVRQSVNSAKAQLDAHATRCELAAKINRSLGWPVSNGEIYDILREVGDDETEARRVLSGWLLDAIWVDPDGPETERKP